MRSEVASLVSTALVAASPSCLCCSIEAISYAEPRTFSIHQKAEMERLVKEELQYALWIIAKSLGRISRSTSSNPGSTEDVLMVTNSRLVASLHRKRLGQEARGTGGC